MGRDRRANFYTKITLTDAARERRTADIILLTGVGRATSSKFKVTRDAQNQRYLLENDGGRRIINFRNFNDPTKERGNTLGHELGHLLLGLFDEYRPVPFPTCGGYGNCIDTVEKLDNTVIQDEFNNCIMDDPNNDFHELCTPNNHDLVKGDGENIGRCLSTDNCELVECENFSVDTGNFETTNPRTGGHSCWTILKDRFPLVISIPNGLVNPVPNNEVQATNIINNSNQASDVVILADVSGSMALPALGSTDPLCVDSNADGYADTYPCSLSRMSYVDDAIDLFTTAAAGDGLRVAIRSFNSSSTERKALGNLTSVTLPSYLTALDSITPSAGTAIGTALNDAQATLDSSAESGRSILLITDGENTFGPDPVPVASQLLNDGTKIFTVVTGADGGVGSVPVLDAEHTSLRQMMALNPAFLRMQILHHWSELTGRYEITPPLRYNLSGKLSTVRSMPANDWPTFWRSWSPATKSASTSIRVIAGSTTLEVIIAEHQDRTRAFDLTLSLLSPLGTQYISSTATTTSGMTVTRRNGYLYAKIANPATGLWTINVSAPSSGEFRGQFQAFSRSPLIFSEIWANKIQSNIFELLFNANIKTSLHNLGSVKFTAVSRNGEVITLNASPDPDDPSIYRSLLNLSGKETSLWDVMATARVTSLTTNEPGEDIFSQPQNTISLPSVHFSNGISVQGTKQ